MEDNLHLLYTVKQLAASKDISSLASSIISGIKAFSNFDDARIVLQKDQGKINFEKLLQDTSDNVLVVQEELDWQEYRKKAANGSMLRENDKLLLQAGLSPSTGTFFYPFDYHNNIPGGILIVSSRSSEGMVLSQSIKLFLQYCAAFFDNFICMEQLKEKVNTLYYYDHLVTQLPNRLYLKKYLSDIINQNFPGFFLLFLDIDDLKRINKLYNYHTGDQLISQVSLRLKKFIGSNWKNCFIARMGGDEFAIILPIVENEVGPEVFAEAILNNIAEALVIDNNKYNLTASIGISRYPVNSISVGGLLECAEKAMFKAKDNGKNQYVLFNSFIQQEE